jgi:hypothetical protein
VEEAAAELVALVLVFADELAVLVADLSELLQPPRAATDKKKIAARTFIERPPC